MDVTTRDLSTAAIHRDLREAGTKPKPLASVSNDKAFSLWLDLIRWVAALAVVFDHSANRFLIRILDLPSAQRTVPFYLFSFVAGFGRQAVMIFFVLSGYLVGGGLWREAKRNGSVDTRKYLVKRVSRLCVVLYPAFLLIVILNLIGIVGFHGMATGVYPSDTLTSMRPASLVCNASFLQTALCDNYGHDGAFWSLYNEFWYYIVWPFILFGILAKSTWKRVGLLILAASMLTILTVIQFDGPAAIGPYMLIWLLGVAVAMMPQPIIRSYASSATLFFVGLLAVRVFVRRSFADIHPVAMFLVDAMVSSLFANLLITMKYSKSLEMPVGKKLNFKLAAFSFSLYCIHTPILNLYGAAMQHFAGTGWRMVPDHLWKWSLIFGAMTLSFSAAFLFSRLTEAHTAALRTWLMRILKLEKKEPQHAIPFN
jgi:peptidoglycan/LPS O-acetylase OafA/YrhL